MGGNFLLGLTQEIVFGLFTLLFALLLEQLILSIDFSERGDTVY